MSTKKTNAQRHIETLQEQVRKISEERDNALKFWREEGQKSARAMSQSFDLVRAQKQILVIEYIAAGRANEAILEILKPVPLVFSMQVMYGDDKSRMAAEDELLARLKKMVVEHVDAMCVKRETGAAE